MPGAGFEPAAFGYLRCVGSLSATYLARGMGPGGPSGRDGRFAIGDPMSPTLHQAEPPRHVGNLGSGREAPEGIKLACDDANPPHRFDEYHKHNYIGLTAHWRDMSLKLVALIVVTILVVAGGAAGWWMTGGFDTDDPTDDGQPIYEEPDPDPDPGNQTDDDEKKQNWTLDGRLRPGSSMNGCTLNFLFEYPDGKLAMGTAGHCAEVDDTVSNPDVGEFGVVVYSVQDFNDRKLDFALIDIYESHFPESNPQMRRWGGPTGFTTSDQTSMGAVVDVYGYAAGAGASETTRPRQGLLVGDDEMEYRTDIPAWWGDSGGPLVMDGDRAALGVVSRIAAGSGSTLTGSTVEWILECLKTDGFEVELILADPL